MCSSAQGARNGFAEPRDREAKSTLSRPQPAAETARPTFELAETPANCGLFVRDRETSVRIGLRSGRWRTRTSNQTVMSEARKVGGSARWCAQGITTFYGRAPSGERHPMVKSN
jgi:hypothetical protein